MARMAQEGIPPGSQGISPSRPLRAPPPAPGAPLGRHQLRPKAGSAPGGTPGAAAPSRGCPERLRPRSCPRAPARPGPGAGSPRPAASPRLPVPAARLLLAGAAPARAQVPGRVPRAARLRPLLVVLRLLHVFGLLDGNADLHRGLGPGPRLLAGLGHGSRAGRECGAAAARAPRPSQPGGGDCDEGAGARRARPGGDGGRGAPPRAAAATAATARAASRQSRARAGGAAAGEGDFLRGPRARPVPQRCVRPPAPPRPSAVRSSYPLRSTRPPGAERGGRPTSDLSVCGGLRGVAGTDSTLRGFCASRCVPHGPAKTTSISAVSVLGTTKLRVCAL